MGRFLHSAERMEPAARPPPCHCAKSKFQLSSNGTGGKRAARPRFTFCDPDRHQGRRGLRLPAEHRGPGPPAAACAAGRCGRLLPAAACAAERCGPRLPAAASAAQHRGASNSRLRLVPRSGAALGCRLLLLPRSTAALDSRLLLLVLWSGVALGRRLLLLMTT